MALWGAQYAGLASAAAPTVALQGTATAQQIENAPLVNQSADVQNRYSSQIIDNRNDVFINQPIINNRDHYVNNINTQVIRDNNYYHYNTQNLYRDNIINTYQNQVIRQTNNFATYSSTVGVLPGTAQSIDYGTTYAGYAAGYAGAAAGLLL